jgi:eukaryotic-like serine/threonine-protein kinase
MDWDNLRDIFEAAWPLKGPERTRLLDERCAGNDSLRAELEALLVAYDEENPAAAPSRRFGAWETTELVGRGGMAEVYLARRADGQHEQRAAVKVMARNLLSWDFMDRFRREREILARLEHPNIARLFDGGVSAAGEPYLVMEFVDGTHLDDYCEKKKLPLAERLRLFLQLCSAVESAHRNLVLHRDIKPSNVLVSEDGTLKLVDFGTARKMDGGNLVTMAPLTPSFASPEQLRGEAVTTLSDVYGLGMTLYRLMTGTLPFGSRERSAYQTVQEALERTPPPPSAAPGLTRAEREALRGDIDNIVLKAIDQKPGRRYLSAEHLAADVRRHLEKRPVEARPKTWAYRAERFVARNRLGTTLAALLVLTLAGAAVAVTIEVEQTKQEAERSRRLASFLSHVLGLGFDVASGPFRSEGRSARVVDAIRYASDHLSTEMAGQSQLEARVRADIGHALEELGYTDEAQRNLARALQLADAKKDAALAVEIKGYLARDAFLQGDLALAAKQFDEAFQQLTASQQQLPPEVENVLLLNAAAVPMTREGATAGARRMIGRAVELGRKVGPRSPAYALALMNHGALTADDNPDLAEREMQDALAIEGSLQPRPLEWCIGMGILAMNTAGRGRLDESEKELNDAYTCEERTLTPDSMQFLSLRLAKIELAAARGNHTTTLDDLAHWEDDIAKQLPKAPWLRAEGQVSRGSLLCALGRREEGRAELTSAVEARRAAFGADSDETKSAERKLAKCVEPGK